MHPLEQMRQSGELRERQKHLRSPGGHGSNRNLGSTSTTTSSFASTSGGGFGSFGNKVQSGFSSGGGGGFRGGFMTHVPAIYTYTMVRGRCLPVVTLAAVFTAVLHAFPHTNRVHSSCLQASDVAYWLVLGGLLLFAPQKALDYHRDFATSFKLAGPSPAVASNALLLYTQVVGALLFSLAVPAAYGFWSRSVPFAQAYAGMRTVLGACLLAIMLMHPLQSTYRILLPFVAHSFWHAGALLSSRDTLRPILKRFGLAGAAAEPGVRATA